MTTPLVKRDIVEFIEADVELVLHGSSDRPYYVGLCPFHDDKNPSFTVYPTTQRFICWTCYPEGGDVIDYVVRRDGKDFAQAVEIACKKQDTEDYLKSKLKALAQPKDDIDLEYTLSVRANKLTKTLDFYTLKEVLLFLDDAVRNRRFAEADAILKARGV